MLNAIIYFNFFFTKRRILHLKTCVRACAEFDCRGMPGLLLRQHLPIVVYGSRD